MCESDLARVMSVDPTAVTKWESGKNNPTADKLMKLADLFQCSLDYLCGREPPENQA